MLEIAIARVAGEWLGEGKGTYGLITMTMPFWQWFVWPQNNHTGLLSLTIIVKTGISGESGDTARNPDLIPVSPPMKAQGSSKVDCATE